MFRIDIRAFSMLCAVVVASMGLASCHAHRQDIITGVDSAVVDVLVMTTGGTVSPTPILPATPYNYATLALPAHFTNGNRNNTIVAADNTPASNIITNAGATLGRVLFYEKNLSFNRTISCASCHKQSASFSDTVRLSIGFAGGQTHRHSMGLANARFYVPGRFFWDERATTLEAQVLMPMQDAVEMGMTLPLVLERLREQSYYTQLFQNAFGSSDITTDRVARALAQFVRSMVSYNSRYDAGRTQVNSINDDFPNFTIAENSGKRLFLGGRGNCSGCHGTDAQIADQATNNGLDASSVADRGVGGITNRPQDVGAFKVPSLRDIAVTPPYMHDGRFQTLEQVVEFYNSGIQPHPNLHPRLRGNNGQPRRMNLSQQEKQNLVAFLRTLTDVSFLTDVKFSDPFIRR